MQITLTPELKQHPEWARLVEGTNETLRTEADLVPSATAAWSVEKDERNGAYLLLRLGDASAGRVSARFAPDELRSGTQVEPRLRILKNALIRVGEWREHVKHLFDQIRAWAKSVPGNLTIEQDIVAVSELHSGDYEMPRLLLRRGNSTMSIEPIAAWTLTGNGRVDLAGLGGDYAMHYIQRDNHWLVEMGTFPPKREVLTKDLFLYLAEACLDG